MKVLAISSYGEVGGSELATVDFIANRPAGVDVHALLVSGGRMEGLLDVPTIVGHGYEGRPGPGQIRRFTGALLPLLQRERYDVVWAVSSKAALMAVAACRIARTPIVWHKTDFAWDRELTMPLGAVVNGVTAVSEALVEALGPLYGPRFLGTVVPPLRLQREPNRKPDPERPVIGTVSRIVPYKGIHHMIRAAALLMNEFPGLRFVAAGGPVMQYPDYPDKCRELARELGIDDRVELPGHVSDVADVYERLDVFLSATFLDDEGFGLEGLGAGTLEASWSRIPVVVARAGGSVEAVDDGVSGTLVDAAEPHALAAGIAPYLRDPELAKRTGERGREFALSRGIEPRVAGERMFALLERATT